MPRHLPQVPAPPYAFVPGRWPHPRRHPDGHSYRQPAPPVVRLSEQRWGDNAAYLRGIDLFNGGYYWEAHEAWELLWLAEREARSVAVAERAIVPLLQGLIRLAAAGVKLRQGSVQSVARHAASARQLFLAARVSAGPRLCGLDLGALERFAEHLESDAARWCGDPSAPVAVVFDQEIMLRLDSAER